MDRVNADYMGMLATIINALAIQDLLERKGVETRVMTAIRMEALAEPYIRRRASAPPREAARRDLRGRYGQSVLLDGHRRRPPGHRDPRRPLIKATKVEGIYTADPEKDPDAEFIPHLTYQDVLTRDLRVMDAAAVSLCRDNDLPIIVLNINERGAVAAALRGEKRGTLVSE
jgi:uridylate kinase